MNSPAGTVRWNEGFGVTHDDADYEKERMMKTLTLCIVAVALSGCKSWGSWRYYAPFGLLQKEQTLSPVDPNRVHYAGVASKLAPW